MQSKSFIDKLSSRFEADHVIEETIELLDLANSKAGFNSHEELSQYISEGALLNVGKIASKALSVPCGDYMVWCTEAGHTMLVPVSEAHSNTQDVFESSSDQYDIFTTTLLNNWNKLAKVLEEDEQPEQFKRTQEADDDDDNELIDSEVDESSVDRTALLRTMQERGFTVSSLADACGVQPPAISRLLREPRSGKGDPGGRNPSMGLAGKICKILRVDPTAVFSDIFSGQYEAKSVKGNRGSGMGGAAKGSTKKGGASEKYTQGNN